MSLPRCTVTDCSRRARHTFRQNGKVLFQVCALHAPQVLDYLRRQGLDPKATEEET